MRRFGHIRYDRDDQGEVIASKASPARAKTVDGLPHNYGTDKGRRLIVSLDAQDLITVRPEKTTRPLQIKAQDLYGHLLRCQANLRTLEKARQSKATKERQRRNARIKRAEKRLFALP